ncbi:MAG: ABC transporter ATP-binding protein [Tindallia sp. MSAO_Bac2]|nr:MAG: ABC transporter ATP-binding protein [Tindallia sp. MSAO_Bac2]
MIIKIEDVSLWRGSKFLLKNVNWQIEEGEQWAIMGLNGSGKTTLLNMINGYLFPSSGNVEVLGKTFGHYDLRELRKLIGWVSTAIQERFYLNESALDIVISGKEAVIGLFDEPSRHDILVASDLLEQLGCIDYAHRPYQTLSQGEKQKVLIARALMAKPRLLILDEPCTGLDLFAREQLLRYIDKLSRQSEAPALIYVTHRTEEILPVFDKVLLMKDGGVFAAGRRNDLMTEELMNEFLEAPVSLEYKDRRHWMNLIAFPE